jgi:hypothetical protein
MGLAQQLRPFAVSLPVRTVCLLCGVAWLVLLVPDILVSLINPSVWYEAAIAAYFLVASVVACVFFFSKRVLLLVLALPAFVYALVSLLWLAF